MLTYFESLGNGIAAEWSKVDYDHRALPQIACEALAAMRPDHHVSWQEIVEWMLTAQSLPPQPNLEFDFGQPPVAVYWHAKFFIEVLHWHSASTDIHQHAFSGAFSVLHGDSIHTQFTFEEERRINTHFLIGRLALKQAEVIHAGAVQSIVSGKDMIHATFHLGAPSVTVVVRTDHDVDSLPQYGYQLPGLAINEKERHPVRRRRLKALELIAAVSKPKYERSAALALAHSDILTAYYILTQARSILGQSDAFERLAAAAHVSFGGVAAELAAAAEEDARARAIEEIRNKIEEQDLKFFVGLLASVPSRSAILSIVRQECPTADPEVKISEWVAALYDSGVLGAPLDSPLRGLILKLSEGRDLVEALQECKPLDATMARPLDHVLADCKLLMRRSIFAPLLAACTDI